MKESLYKFAAGLSAMLLLSSCASVTVQKETEHNAATKPKKLYVAGFNMSKGEFNVDREGPELVEFKKNLRDSMQHSMVNDLTIRLMPAVAATKGHEFDPENGWLIRGEFIKVNQGSRFLRGVVGLGAGGTKMETKITVYDLTSNTGRPIMTFTTTGGSNAEPGAITAIATDPVLAVIGAGCCFLPGLAHGVSEDTGRTAREITAEISDYLHRRGWIPDSQWIKPKMANKLTPST